MRSAIRRRTVIAGGIGVAATGAFAAMAGHRELAVTLNANVTGEADAARIDAGAWKGNRSQNGWPVPGSAHTYRIEGAGRTSVRLAPGAAAILLHVARRFNYEIDALRAGDVVGHTTDRHVRQPYESNHLSGTAIAIRPDAYPLDVAGGFFPAELVVVRDILAECGGVVAWGGDEKVPKESHFQLVLKPSDPRVKRLAARIGGWEAAPGEGAGTVDAFVPSRLQAARAFRSHHLVRP